MGVAIVFKFEQPKVETSHVIKTRTVPTYRLYTGQQRIRMDVSTDFVRGCLLYDFKVGLSAAASSRRICQAFGNSAMNERTARRWFKKFKSGDLSLRDERRSGRPQVLNDGVLKAAIEEDSSLTCGELARQLNVSDETVRLHLHRLDHPMKAHLNHGVVSSRFKRSTKSSTEMSIEEKEAHEQVEMTTKRKIAESGDSVHTRTLPFKCSPHSGQQAVQELGERPGSNSSKGKCSKRVQKSKSKQIGVQRETKARGRMTRGTSNGGASDCSEEGAVVDFSFVKEELNSNDLVIKEHNVGEYFLKEEMDGMDEVVVKEKNVDESLMDEDEFHVKVDSSLDYIMKEEHEIDERLKEEPGGMPAEDCNGKEVKEWCIEGCIIKQEVVEEL
ncbi:uncharacterized protein LOC143034476 isoform X1 [Oratosquilla oratoria]|uniref:uncharacterized protein LOC143034476 isoform X1 n=1 Tax=Oratosquilla oratoria TaxID=337810 RepID=UPI003F76690C